MSFSDFLGVLRRRQIALLLSIYFLFFFAFVFLQAALSPWLQAVFGFGSLETGLVFFFIGAVSVFTQVVVLPQLSRRVSRLNLVLFSTVLFVVGLAILSAVGNIVLMLSVAALISMGFGLTYVSLNTLISLSSTEEAQGGTLGIAWAVAALAQTAAPVLSATAFSFGVGFGFDGLVFLVSAAIALASLPFVLSFRKFFKE